MLRERLTPELVGKVWVDSGQLMIGDPCYLKDWQDTDADMDRLDAVHGPDAPAVPSGAFTYQGACEATCSPAQVGMLGQGLAAVFSSGYGDGEYPVYAHKNKEGRVMRVTVEMA